MSNRFAKIVILAEDGRHADFARGWLKRRGHDPRRFRTNICPPGSGSGEQYVREHYSGELMENRRLAACQIALVVLIDADFKTTVQRHQQLERVAKRRHDESVAILVPKQNIETWLLFLCGRDVTEELDCKLRPLPKRAVARAAEQFATGINTPPTHWLPSLQDAAIEAKRIPTATS